MNSLDWMYVTTRETELLLEADQMKVKKHLQQSNFVPLESRF